MAEVIGTDEFAEWFGELDEADQDSVAHVVDMLEMLGVKLPFPYSTGIKGCNEAIRELRVKAHGAQIRVFYAFDPLRQAVLLIGGVKSDERFYEEFVPRAERIWAEYREETIAPKSKQKSK